MTEPYHVPERLKLLLTELLDGALTDPQLDELREMVRVDPAARDFYVRHMMTHAMLQWEHSQVHPGVNPSTARPSSAPSPVMEEGVSAEAIILPQPTAAAAPAPPVQSPVLGFLGGVVSYVSHSRTMMFWLMFAAMVGVFTIHFGGLLLSRIWDQKTQMADGGVGRHANGPTDHPEPVGKIVARLTNAIDCKWSSPRAAEDTNRVDRPNSIEIALDTEFSAGQQLNLTDGLAEITFDSGAKLILHAPAQFAVGEALGGSLQLGRLTAKVPHSAHGFTIDTPGGKVVDLGTEFGVKVNQDRSLHVTVFVGDVVVQSAGANGGVAEQVHVKAGEAIVVSPGQPIKSTPASDERFVRDLAPLGDKAVAEAAYVEFVKKLKPVVWFRMEGKDTERVLHDEMGGPDAKLVWDGPGNPYVKGAIGKGLWLRGPQLKEYAIVPDYPKAEHGKLSACAWVYADSHPRYAGIAKNWGESGSGQFEFATYETDGDLCLYLATPDKKYTFLREGAAHPVALNEWQHVAFTTDGSTVRLYRQGREVAAAKHAGLRFPVRQHSLGIGVKIDDSELTPSKSTPGYWSGKLDEIAVFNDTLSAEDIRKLAGAAPR